MIEVGGYHEIEDVSFSRGAFHNTLSLKSGRAALRKILNEANIKKLYLPFFSCDTLIEPFQLESVEYQFLAINSLFEFEEIPSLGEGEAVLAINYFGLKEEYIEHLSCIYGSQLIIDNTQSFYQKSNGKSWSFNSTRKFFGVPDGAYLYAPENVEIARLNEPNKSYRVDHLYMRKERGAREGYSAYLDNESLIDSSLNDMSIFSRYYLQRIDYNLCKSIRLRNFSIANRFFAKYNHLKIDATVPGLFYPLLLNVSVDKAILHQNNIYVPTVWPDVLKRGAVGFEYEKTLASNLIPVPIDHRYSEEQCTTYCDLICKLLKL